MTPRTILVPTDFSPHAEAALDYALSLAATLGASIHLLHVVDDPMNSSMWSAASYKQDVPGLLINPARDADEALRRRIETLGQCGVKVSSEVRVGPVSSTIVHIATSREADLIVIGTKGRSAVARLMIGSVAGHVVRHAPCPVLVVRPIAPRASDVGAEHDTVTTSGGV